MTPLIFLGLFALLGWFPAEAKGLDTAFLATTTIFTAVIWDTVFFCTLNDSLNK